MTTTTPQKLDRAFSLTLRTGLVLTVSLFLANVSSFLFQVVAGRFLTPDEYGLLSSIFTLILIVGVATSSLQAAFAKAEVARRDTVVLRPRRNVALVLADPLVRVVLLVSIGFGLLVVAMSPFLGHFFHSATLPIIMFAALVPAITMLSLSMGRLQGMERFTALAGLSVGIAVSKLVLCGGVLAVGLGVTCVIGVLTLTSAAAAFAGLVLTSDSPPLVDRAVFGDIARALIALTLFWLVVGVDVPLARHWLSGEAAGQYAAASVIGKGVLWLPDIVALVVFPELASARSKGREVQHLLRRAAVLSLVICLLGTLGLWLVGDLMFDQLFGGQYAGAASLAWRLGLVSTPLALANLFIFFHVAGRAWGWLFWLGTVLVLQVAAFAAFHAEQGQFVAVTAVGALALAIGLGVPALRSSGRVPAVSP